ncbi:MAG: response regulator [Bdellovibrionales bacterium]|nr:response regulator [Bdellovibrionales bacterium]
MSSLVSQHAGEFRDSKILVVDDDWDVGATICDLMQMNGYNVSYAASATAALDYLKENDVDLVISDVRMPGINGFEFCRLARTLWANEFVPIILLTGNESEFEMVKGLDSGADDFIMKPPLPAELFAKIRALLRLRSLQLKNKEQAEMLSHWNRDLESRVQNQVTELQRLERFKRYFSPHVAELIVGDDFEARIGTHRREITSLFVDLRGFTAFAESASPDDVMRVLNEFYAVVGGIAMSHNATVGSLTGDGMMFFFNDPVEIPNHRLEAVRVAVEIRGRVRELTTKWQQQGYRLGFGIGLAEGHATIGGLGFNAFWTYTVVGSTVNLAARLCAEARDGEILVSDRFRSSVQGSVQVEPCGLRSFKGFSDGIVVFNVTDVTVRSNAA